MSHSLAYIFKAKIWRMHIDVGVFFLFLTILLHLSPNFRVGDIFGLLVAKYRLKRYQLLVAKQSILLPKSPTCDHHSVSNITGLSQKFVANMDVASCSIKMILHFVLRVSLVQIIYLDCEYENIFV